MRNSTLIAASAAIVAATGSALTAFAETVDVGWRERAEIRVPGGQTATQTDRVSVDSTGHLYKTGDGTLVLPTASIVQTAPLEIGVLGGNLTLQAGGTAPAITQPAVIADKAALWLDAQSANLLTTNGTPYRADVHGNDNGELVAEWLDARATSASDSRYLRASPIWWTGNGGVTLPGDGIPPSKVAAYGQTGVWFGGIVNDNGTQKTSGQSLVLRSASQATGDDNAYTTMTDILHVFLVQAVSNWWGYILGNYRDTTQSRRDFYATTGNGINGALFEPGYSGSGAVNTGRIFYDGVNVNQYLDTISNHLGLHLFEIELTDRPGQFQAFFRDSTVNAEAGLYRNGGDYLYEAIVFTNKVTDVERGQIRAWLMDKWGIPAMAGATPAVRLEGGSFSFADGSASPLAFSGVGAVAYDTATGAVLPRGTEVVAEPKSGSIIAVDSALAGDAVTKTVGKAGAVRKTGRGRIAVATLPADVATLDVANGVLRLAPAAAPTAVDSIAADPEDPSFERFFTTYASQVNSGRLFWATGAGNKRGAWQYDTLANAANAGFVVYNYRTHSNHFATWPAPDGDLVLYLKGTDCQGTADVTVPADGIYELSFFASAREACLAANKRNHIDLYIGENDESMIRFGNLVKSPSSYYRLYYRTPRLTGGRTYKLRFRSRDLNIDAATDFDDIQLRLIPDGELEAEGNLVTVPNGDFENVADLGRGNGSISPYLSFGNTTEGWEFISESTAGNGVSPSVSLVEQGISANSSDYDSYNGPKTSPYTRSFYSYYDCAGPNVFGFAQLGLFSTGGVARTTSAFTPPAGTYRLRIDAARWACLTFNGIDLLSMPQLQARVAIGGGAATSLGTVSHNSHGLAPVTFPNSFTVDGTQNVMIELRQTAWKGGALIDNVVLVPVREPSELLANGSFEDCVIGSGGFANENSMADWSADHHADSSAAGYSSQAVWERFDRDNGNYATNIVDGIIRLKLRGQGEITQGSISLGAGFHRLRFWAESRHNPTGGGLGNGRNPIRAYLTHGAVTNDIGWTYVDSTNFVEHAFLFRVPEAGTYTLHLQGMSSPGSNWWDGIGTANDRMSLVDAVSLKAVDAADVPATPGLSEETAVSVANGARMELEFSGTQKIAELCLGDKRVHGIVSASTNPEYLSGPGSFEVPEQAFSIIIR